MNEILINKKILLGMSGGIAAYKCAELVRELRRAQAEVKVVMTQAAQAFVTPLTFQALSGNLVYCDDLQAQSQHAMDHIDLARWADLLLIAPATADIIARLAYGHANDLLTTLTLATTAPVAIAPAMNQQMWQHPRTQENISRLRQANNTVIWGPNRGEQACGEYGPGRMLEPLELINQLQQFFSPALFNGEKIIITAGPTQEALDPVRYLSNYSSGKMGYALAQAAAESGADVTLISGPSALPKPTHSHIQFIPVITAEQMHAAVMQNVMNCTIFIAAAAVADYRAKTVLPQKIKKQTTELTLTLERNPDILREVAALPQPPFTVGFAAETEHLLENAQNKLKQKNIDMIIANSVADGQGFLLDHNQVIVLTQQGDQIKIPTLPKLDLARKLMTIISCNYSS